MKKSTPLRRLISLLMVTAMLPLSGCNVVDPVPDAVRAALPTLMTDTYQAETATLKGAAVGDQLHDFSGDGYATLAAGTDISFALKVDSQGTYGVTLRYVNGTGEARPVTLSVNGGEAIEETLDTTPNDTTWCEKLVVVALGEGDNTLTVSCPQGSEGISIDKIDLCRAYPAEDALIFGGAKKLRAYKGFTGTGYVNLHQKGNGVRYTVNAPVDGSYEMTLRYLATHGNSDGRSLTLTINSETSEKVVVCPTHATNKWGVYRHTVTLKAGENVLDLWVADDDNAELSLDCITLKPTDWTYAGKVESVSGSGTSQLDFTLDNCVIRINSVAANSIRVWVDPEGKFTRKYESAAVVNEAVDPQELKVKEKDKYYYFETGDMTVRVYKDPLRIVYLNADNEIITMNDAYSLGWSSDDERICRNVIGENEHFWGLGETPVSFDRLGTKIALWGNDRVAAQVDSAVTKEVEDGRWYMNNPVFTSSKGYTIFFDNPSRTVFDFGATDAAICSFGSLNPYPAGELIYYFIYGPSVKDEMTGLSDIIGKSFFSPEWGYGNMQSHWGYTQADMERVSQEYRDKGIPLDVIIADIEWYENFCTPTEWNHKNFPDPDSMIAKLKELNLRFGVIDDPNVTDGCEDFKDGDEKGYFVVGQDGNTSKVTWPWGGPSGLTDFFNPMACSWWKSLHRQVMEQGVSFFWMDMNEPAEYNTDWYFSNEEGKAMGTIADCKNIFAQMQQRTLYDMMTDEGKRVLLLTRSGYTGTQRYACPWTGDIQSDWAAMQQQLSLGLGLSMSGYMYWTFDIGGSAGSFSSEEHMRWVELGTFMPITRYHSTSSLEGPREPYTYGCEEVARTYISMRYQFLPYFYSLSADSIIGIGYESEAGTGSGLPLVRPMLMEFDSDENTWALDQQFMSGQSILVAPVMDNQLKKDVYFPEGTWYDYYTGTTYQGGQTVTVDAPLDLLPLFVKEGSIIPTRDTQMYVDEKELTTLYLDVYPTDGDGSYRFVYYEDDGLTDDYMEGVYATTSYEGTTKGNTHTLSIGDREGKYTDIADRDYILRFHVGNKALKEVTVDGRTLSTVSSYDALTAASEGVCVADDIVYVKLHDTASAATVTVKTK